MRKIIPALHLQLRFLAAGVDWIIFFIILRGLEQTFNSRQSPM